MNTRSINDLLPNNATAHQGPLTVSSAAVTLLSLVSGTAFHAQTDYVLLSVETDQVRITVVGGTNPTATLGYLLEPGQMYLLSLAEATVAKLIRVTTDAKLQVSEFKNR